MEKPNRILEWGRGAGMPTYRNALNCRLQLHNIAVFVQTASDTVYVGYRYGAFGKYSDPLTFSTLLHYSLYSKID